MPALGHGEIIYNSVMLLLESELKPSFATRRFSTLSEDEYPFCHSIEGDEYATISTRYLYDSQSRDCLTIAPHSLCMATPCITRSYFQGRLRRRCCDSLSSRLALRTSTSTYNFLAERYVGRSFTDLQDIQCEPLEPVKNRHGW